MLPLETEPRNKVKKDYIPPNSEAYVIKEGDNWNLIAKKIGMDVWDLIDFNFKTRNPQEVNWYLHHYLGCDMPTADGKNWRFCLTTKRPIIIHTPITVISFPELTMTLIKHKTPCPRTLIERENNITAGDLKSVKAFDLALYYIATGSYILDLFMKVQFFFKAETPFIWSNSLKKDFVRRWESSVCSIFDNLVIKVLSNGKTVMLKLSLETQIEGIMFDHWEVTVSMKKNCDRSNVDPSHKNPVQLCDQDNIVIIFSSTSGKTSFNTSAHEFAHMLGIADEYGPEFQGTIGPYNWDHFSLLNVGTVIRPRHLKSLQSWLDKALSKHGIK